MNHTTPRKPKPSFDPTSFRAVLWLCGLMVAAFVLDWLTAGWLTRWGASNQSLFLQGEYWRLLSSSLLHGNFGHLTSNLAWIILFGLVLHSSLGVTRFLTIFLVCAAGASLLSMVWNDNAFSVGSSGAIMGFFGAGISYALRQKRWFTKLALLALLLVPVLSTFLGGLSPNVDNAAHLGGLITGMLLSGGYALYDRSAANKRAGVGHGERR